MSAEAESPRDGAAAPNDAELIAHYVELDPNRPGRAEARLRLFGIPVWAIIGQYQATGRDAEAIAEGYRIPVAAVRAALAYYRQHMELIEDRLEANAV